MLSLTTCCFSHLWCTTYVFLHESRVGVVLDVMSIDVVLQVIKSVINGTGLKLQHTHLKYVHLKRPTNNTPSLGSVVAQVPYLSYLDIRVRAIPSKPPNISM